MKVATAVCSLLFIIGSLTISAPTSAPIQQPAKPSTDLEKLEAQFKELDGEPGLVTVAVSGDKESSANLKVTIQKKEVSPVAIGTESSKTGGVSWTKETVLNVDLGAVAIPDEYINEKIAAAFTDPKGILPGVKVMQIDASGIYEVVENYTYQAGTYNITALTGFRYDRASVPRIVWVLIDKDSLSNVAPLFHDLLYRNGGVLPENQVTPYRKFSRKETDDLFLDLMTKCGVKKWRRDAAYRAVRGFAGPAWKAK